MQKKKIFHIFAAGISVIAVFTVFYCLFCAVNIPSTMEVPEGTKLTFTEKGLTSSVRSVTGNQTVAASAATKAGNKYVSQVRLLGVIPVKNVTVHVVKQTYVIPCGQAFGVRLYTKGVMVVGLTDVDSPGGLCNPAYDAGIRVGDVILAINGKPVYTNAQVSGLFETSNGRRMKVNVVRNNCAYIFFVKPVKSNTSDAFKGGMWVRDSTAGIGTLTFFIPSSGRFCGLGHGICDVDTGEILPLLDGDISKVSIDSVLKGKNGEPGELKGTFFHNSLWGNLLCNCKTGIYGQLASKIEGTQIPVAFRQQVHTGPAEILTTIDGTAVHRYAIQIEKVHFDDSEMTKNMVIRITDKSLLAKTGGIVQGMSGSPIIQDGMLAGAVTHVFINDPSKGYGIFAENMLNTLNSIEISNKKDVS